MRHEKIKTGYSNKSYGKSFQLAGGSLGHLDAAKKEADLNESEGREVILETYNRNGWGLGGHKDNEHNHVKTFKELKKRKKGCGNLAAKAAGKIPMYDGTITEEIAEDRLDWIEANNGEVYPLANDHKEKLSAVNLVPGQTFDTPRAEDEGHAAFNLDLDEAYKRGGEIYETLVKRGNPKAKRVTKEEFQKEHAENVFRDYLQTVKALGGETTIFVRK